MCSSDLTAAKVEEFHVYCKSTNYGREYKVALKHEDWAYEIEVIFQIPTGNDASTDSKKRYKCNNYEELFIVNWFNFYNILMFE